jgi:O-antigen/teichoic acid export membrane protein
MKEAPPIEKALRGEDEPITAAAQPSAPAAAVLTRNSWVALVGGLASQALKFLVVVYVARSYGATAFGSFSFAVSVNAFIFVVSNFGLPVFGAREVAQASRVSPGLTRSVSNARLLLAISATGVALAVLFFVPSVNGEELLLVLGFGLSDVMLAFLYDWAFQGMGKLHGWAALNVLWQGLWLVLSVAVVRAHTSIAAVSFAYAAGAGVAALVGWLWLKGMHAPSNSEPDSAYSAWSVFRSGTALGTAWVLITVLAWSDTIIVRLIGGPHAAGIYAAGNRAALALCTLSSFYVLGAFSHLSAAAVRSPEEFQEYFRKCYRDLALIFVPGSIWAIFYAPQILLVIFRQREYLAAVPIFRTFQIFLLLTVASTLYGVGALVTHRLDHVYRRTLAASAGLLLILCPILALQWGLVGAAAAALLSQGLCLTIFAVEGRHLLRVDHLRLLAAPVCAGFAAVGVGAALHLELWGGVAVLSLIYLALLGREKSVWRLAAG